MEKDRRRVRWLGVLGLVGGFTAVPLIIAFAVTEWGPPGTLAYQRYELLNRLMALSLLLMSAGWLGVLLVWPGGYGRWGALLALLGSLVMVIGTAAEFWLFSNQPYGQTASLRNAAWSAFGIGGWLLIIGAMLVGAAAWRSGLWPRWTAVILILALPVELVAYVVVDSPFLGATILALTISLQLLATEKIPLRLGRPFDDSEARRRLSDNQFK